MTNVQGTSAALDDGERRKLLDIVGRLTSSPKTVDAGELASARNLAARAGFHRTKVALDKQIELRGEGAQDPDALRAAEKKLGIGASPSPAPVPPTIESKPVWPFVIGAIALVSGLSYVSHRGHHEVAARIAREKRLQRSPF